MCRYQKTTEVANKAGTAVSRKFSEVRNSETMHTFGERWKQATATLKDSVTKLTKKDGQGQEAPAEGSEPVVGEEGSDATPAASEATATRSEDA
eukprot:m.128949 g.128949  ORF g.128949 m.128949 type:complete len:94 (+) comp16750_c0_seq6:117-398(+)